MDYFSALSETCLSFSLETTSPINSLRLTTLFGAKMWSLRACESHKSSWLRFVLPFRRSNFICYCCEPCSVAPATFHSLSLFFRLHRFTFQSWRQSIPVDVLFHLHLSRFLIWDHSINIESSSIGPTKKPLPLSEKAILLDFPLIYLVISASYVFPFIQMLIKVSYICRNLFANYLLRNPSRWHRRDKGSRIVLSQFEARRILWLSSQSFSKLVYYRQWTHQFELSWRSTAFTYYRWDHWFHPLNSLKLAQSMIK